MEQMGAIDENAVDSSTTETTEQEQTEEVQAEGTSADLENTEETKHVPYDRFKQVNDKFRQTEKEFNEYKERMKSAESILDVAAKDEVFNKEFNTLIEKYNRGELTRAEEKQVEKQIAETTSDPKLDSIVERLERDTYNRYDTDFRSLAKEDFEDPEDLALVGKMLTDVINEKHPNALEGYNPQLVSTYYPAVKEKVDKMIKRKMGNYINDKASDDIPSNKPGTAPSYDVDIANAPRSQRSAHLADRLKLTKE